MDDAEREIAERMWLQAEGQTGEVFDAERRGYLQGVRQAVGPAAFAARALARKERMGQLGAVLTRWLIVLTIASGTFGFATATMWKEARAEAAEIRRRTAEEARQILADGADADELREAITGLCHHTQADLDLMIQQLTGPQSERARAALRSTQRQIADALDR